MDGVVYPGVVTATLQDYLNCTQVAILISTLFAVTVLWMERVPPV